MRRQTSEPQVRATEFMSLRMGIILAIVFCLMAAALIATMTGSAANPTMGTITAASGPLTYTAGPFVVANPSAQAGGTPICAGTGQDCDNYTLTVNAASVAATKKLMIQVAWPVTTADFDLYVLQGATLVKSSASSADPETVIIDIPANGTVYTIRVAPFAPAGQSITGTISLVDAVPPPPPPTGAAPRYQNYSAPAGLGSNAGEPSLGVDWNPNVPSLKNTTPPMKLNTGGVAFFQSGPNTLRSNFDDCSSPAKNQWDDVSTPFVQQSALSDPIGFVDRQTGRVFSLDLIGGQGNSTMAFSDDDGTNYTPGQGGGAGAGPDHQTLGSGPYNPNSVPAPPPHPTYTNATYYCSQNIAAEAQCSRSDDGGLTFGPSVPLYNPAQCTGNIHGHVKVAPDGTVYVPNYSCASGGGVQGVEVSTDNGITWTNYTVAGTTGPPGLIDPSVGVGLNNVGKPAGQSTNTIYLGLINGDGHAMVATSHDRGQHFVNYQDVGASFSIKNSVFPVVVAGDDNRAAFAFLGTTTGGNFNSPTFAGIWHLYVATTYDGGLTWLTTDATPTDPVQVGAICMNGTTCPAADRNLLDFNDFTVDSEGRGLVGYSDGCLAPTCTATSPHAASASSKATITRQSGGRRLFAAFDPVEPAAPAAPRVDSVTKGGTGIVHLAWAEPDNGGSPLTGYNVYRKVGAGGVYALLSSVTLGCPACKTTYDESTALPNTQYFYKVTAKNVIGEGTNCRDFSVGVVVDNGTPCIAPGVTIFTDPAGDNTDNPNTQHDLLSLQMGQPYDAANPTTNKVYFTLKVGDLNPVPAPSSRWTIFFTRTGAGAIPPATSTEWFVDMVTDSAGSPGTPVYQYGHTSIGTGGIRTLGTDGTADGGIETVDGKIVIQLSNPTRTGTGAVFPAWVPGETLSNINAITQQSGVALLATVDSSDTGGYTVISNQSCAPNTAPIPDLQATPMSGNATLNVNFDGSASHDLDPGDTIASYTFDFGDGSPAVTQSMPTIAHSYLTAGDYPARLTVTDSRGKASDNASQVIISVEQTSARTNYALRANGGTATGSSEYYTNGFPAASAINGDRTGGNWGSGAGGWNDGTRDVQPDSLEVAFSGAKTIDEIRLYTLQDQFTNAQEPTANMTCTVYGNLDFDVQYWNGSAWVTVPGGSVTNNDKVERVFTFPAVTTTKIRVVVNAARVHFSRIVELEAFGAGGQ